MKNAVRGVAQRDEREEGIVAVTRRADVIVVRTDESDVGGVTGASVAVIRTLMLTDNFGNEVITQSPPAVRVLVSRRPACCPSF